MLIPPVVVGLSRESVSGGLVIGGALVLVGAYLGAMRHAGEPAEAVQPIP